MLGWLIGESKLAEGVVVCVVVCLFALAMDQQPVQSVPCFSPWDGWDGFQLRCITS